jgi:hypothetical protein
VRFSSAPRYCPASLRSLNDSNIFADSLVQLDESHLTQCALLKIGLVSSKDVSGRVQDLLDTHLRSIGHHLVRKCVFQHQSRASCVWKHKKVWSRSVSKSSEWGGVWGTFTGGLPPKIR